MNFDVSQLGYLGTIFFCFTTGLLYFFPARRKQIDDATKTLVATLDHSVQALQKDSAIKDRKIEEQDKKIGQLEEHQRENIKEIQKIKEERDGFQEILEARDKNTQDFQKQCLESIKVITQTYELIKTFIEAHTKVIDGLNENNQSTKRLVDILDKHFLNVESAAIK